VSYDFDLLVPLALDPVNERSQASLIGHCAAKTGVAIPTADADAARLINVWMASWTNGPGSDPKWYLRWKITPALQQLKETVVGSIQAVLWVVMATIGVVMLIACTNVANLLLVRADGRQQELAIRSALGAGRWRIARELLLESLTLGILGGAAGVALAFAGLRLLTAIGQLIFRVSARSRSTDAPSPSRSFSPFSPASSSRRPGAAVSPVAPAPDPLRIHARRDADSKRKPRTAARPQPARDGQVAMALVLLISAVS